MGAKSWGVLPEQAQHAVYYTCEGCGWPGYLTGDEELCYDRIVGFVVERYGEIVGKVVIDCERCGSKFWFHLSTNTYIRLIQEGRWPRGNKFC